MALRSLYKLSTALSKNVIRPRSFSSTTANWCAGQSLPKDDREKIHVTFVKSDGQRFKVDGKIDDSLLDTVIAHSLDQEFEGYGACEGTLTCSTCHVILTQKDYEKLPEKPGEDESDMLDLAYELTETSRLGCQVVLSKELDGMEVRVPATINDIRR